MVFFILTRLGYENLSAFLKDRSFPIWLNHGILTDTELTELRDTGLEASCFSYFIEPSDQKAIQNAVDMMQLHHPNQTIWLESIGSRPA